MLATIIAALSDSLLKALFGLLSQEMDKRGLIQQGQSQQAAAETAKSEAVMGAVAQAQADAPKSKDAALARLKGGSA